MILSLVLISKNEEEKMELPSRIIYMQEHFDRVKNITSVVEAIDVSSSGRYMFQYNDAVKNGIELQLVIGEASEDLINKINDKIPDGVFDERLISICKNKFIKDETKDVTRITISRQLNNSEQVEKTTLEWDAYDFITPPPKPLLQMVVDISEILIELASQAEHKILDDGKSADFDKLV